MSNDQLAAELAGVGYAEKQAKYATASGSANNLSENRLYQHAVTPPLIDH